MKETCIATFANENATKKAIIKFDYTKSDGSMQLNLEFEPAIVRGEEPELYAQLAIKFFETLKNM